jgi:hypothetical protein
MPTTGGTAASVEAAEKLPFGDAFRSCVSIWLLTRIVTLAAAGGIALATGKSFTYPWQTWDGRWFLHIAQHGYAHWPLYEETPAFYPLYPGLLWLAGAALGGHTLLAGILIAFPLTLAAFVLLYVLSFYLVGERGSAQRAVAYIALFPYAFILQTLYSETTFLVCALATFLFAERRRFLAAAIFAGAAMLARPFGIAVLAGLFVLAWSDRARWAALTRVAVAPVIFGVFPLVLVLQGRSPFAFLTVEHGWRKYSRQEPLDTALAPFQSVYDGAQAAGIGVGKLVSGSPLSPFTVHDVTAFAVLVVFVPLSVVAWRRLGSAYGVYCAVSLLIPLTAPATAAPLLSLQRFALLLFPCFIVLGALPLRRHAFRAVLVASCAALLALMGLLYLWVQGGSFVT